jgi:hypothetical protein
MSQIASEEFTAAPQFGYGNVDAITTAASLVIISPQSPSVYEPFGSPLDWKTPYVLMWAVDAARRQKVWVNQPDVSHYRLLFS